MVAEPGAYHFVCLSATAGRRPTSRQVYTTKVVVYGPNQTKLGISIEVHRAAGGATTTLLSNEEAPSGAGSACDIYQTLCLGADSYGVVRLQGSRAAHIMVLQPGVARGGDEMGQRGSVAWKFWYACAILREDGVAVIEHGASAFPEQ
jgi:hypothetical protein